MIILLSALTIVNICVIVIFFQVFKAEVEAFNHHIEKIDESNLNILVLGAEAKRNHPSPELESRLNLAITLGKNRNSKFYLYGGVGEVNETKIMKKYLIERGIPRLSIFTDSSGINTWESISRYSEVVLDSPCNLNIAVTSGFHAFRVRRTGKKHRIQLVVKAPKNSPENRNSAVRRVRIATEILAIIWYGLPRLITRNINTGHNTFRQTIPNWIIDKIQSTT